MTNYGPKHGLEDEFLGRWPKGEGLAVLLFMAGLPLELGGAAGVTRLATAPEEMTVALSVATGACIALAISLPFLGGCLFYRHIATRNLAKQLEAAATDAEAVTNGGSQ